MIRYIEANTLADINLDVFVFKSNYSFLAEKFDLQIWDNDWNKHYIWASTVLKLPLIINLEFNIKNQNVSGFEVSVEEFYGFYTNCQEPILSDAAENCSS